MPKVPIPRALKRALPVVLLVAAVAIGVSLRVRHLRHEMMSRWQTALDGGAQTTQATVDEWFTDRNADAEALATSVAVHAAFPRAGDSSPPLVTVLAPVVRRGKFMDAWVVDQSGRVIAHAAGDTLRIEEQRAADSAVARNRSVHSAVVVVGPHAATMSFAVPVRVAAAGKRDAASPAAVLLRADLVKAFAPWAVGRPNAAMSMFSSPAEGATVLIRACPTERVPVCVERLPELADSTPAALALAGKDTFGLFTGADGARTLALTRFDRYLGWGVIRRVSYADAQVPLDTEMYIEGAFLLALLALGGLGAYAANRTVRVRRLYAQREATVRLSSVVDASTDGIISLDHRFDITMVNAAVERMLGYTKAALIGRPVFVLFAAEWHVHLSATLREFAESSVSHAPVDETERCIARCASGDLMPVDARVGRADVNGAPVYVMGLRDVSERARTENFLKGQRHVLEMIARGAPAAETCDVLLSVVHAEASQMRCAIYELDTERALVRFVSAAGLPAAVVSRLRASERGRDVDTVGVALLNDTACGLSLEDGSLREEGQLRTVSSEALAAHGILGAWTIPLQSADGQVIGGITCYFDSVRAATVREHELAGAAAHLASIALSSARDAAALRISEASFRSFVENTPSAIFRETRAGSLESTNRAMIELLGYPDAQTLQVAASDGRLYGEAASRARLVSTLEAHDIVQGVELEWRRADGSPVAVRVSARAYRDEQGAVSLWEGYAENVTSLRLAQEALRRSEKLAAVGQLISGVAHELNNPLSSILHFAEDLLADDRAPDDAEALGVIRDQARRSRAIVRDLLSFVRQREANTFPIGLAEVVMSTVKAMAPSIAASGVVVSVADDSQGALVVADRAGIEQIVTNVVGNAIQASPREAVVSVVTRIEGDECQLVVEDAGAGISEDVMPRIFDPFFTTKLIGGGTGLGLSVTLGIVEQLGGRITASARSDGPGTRFVVALPRAHVEPAASAPSVVVPTVEVPAATAPSLEAVPAVAAPAFLALIIDDEPSIRAALRRYFIRRGWGVEEAADGNAGLARLEELGDRIGVVVSDLRMPGFSGIELHDRLAVDRPALLRRFIFSTGDVASSEAASFVQRTRCPVLQKPFELRMLDDIIARVVEGADAGRVVA